MLHLRPAAGVARAVLAVAALAAFDPAAAAEIPQGPGDGLGSLAPAEAPAGGTEFGFLATPPLVDLSPDPEGTWPPPAPAPFGGPIRRRPKLTGDWLGLRGGLSDRGIVVDVSTTQYYQGVATGGLEREFFYGGRNDYFLTGDGETLGLWRGLYLGLHGETRYGQSASFATGSLSPVNEFLKVPGERGVVSGLTAVRATQALSEETLIFAGKINLLDEVKQPLTGAIGTTGFLNTSLIFNTILARALPYSSFGAGIIRLKDEHPVLALSVFDSNDSAASSGFENFFDNGAVILAAGVVPTGFIGLPGHQGIEGVYSSGRYTSLQPSPYLDTFGNPLAPAPRDRETGTWALGYLFDQALWASPDDPGRVWGVFGRLGISDGNPNPIRWTAMAGAGGASPLPGRDRDTFGVGYYFLGLGDAVKRSVGPGTALRDEQGIELYYNCSVTPWLQVTPDVQIIVPFLTGADTALVLGLRAKVDF